MKLKKLVSFILAGAAAVSLCSCGGGVSDNSVSSTGADGGGKPAILIVSFGTSYNETREATIEAIEKKAAEAYPEYDVRRAFTSQTIINKLKERDGIEIDNVESALERLVADKVKDVVVQPTHVMNGYEYEELAAAVKPYEDKFSSLKLGAPLLTSSTDYEKVVNAIVSETPQIEKAGNAVIMVGHGTEHYADAAYAALDYRFKAMGYDNVFIGTVEGYPDMDTVKAAVSRGGYTSVTLMPLMIVAGDHATNDICGEEEGSWATEFKKEGYVVEGVKKGLGEYAGLRDIFIEHIAEALDSDASEEE